MRIGLFFGSFNPPHIGHTVIASFMREAMEADEVWMVVSPQNPFKTKAGLLDETKRIQLVDLALEGLSNIKSSSVEFSLERPSYTVDTMKHLTATHPEHDFFLIMGSDNILHIEKWKDYKHLLSTYDIAVYPREGYELSEALKDNLPDTVKFIDCPIVELSSTRVRKRIKEKKDYAMLLRKAVAERIEEEGYYT
jgi:nicotinate-nucleotide adenylyltransferase